MCEVVKDTWVVDSGGSEMWGIIKDSLINVAQSTLGWESKEQPDWFKEREFVLKELVDKRNVLFKKWLRSGISNIMLFRGELWLWL